MDLQIATRGFVLGLTIAAPVGPIGTLVIRRSLTNGMVAGLCTGMGAAVADSIYAAVGALGVATGAEAFTTSWPFRAFATALLAWLALRTLLEPTPLRTAEPMNAASHGRAFASTVALTLANPSTILSFVAASTAVGVGSSFHSRSAVAFVMGVFAGSTAWWFVLSFGVSRLRNRFGPRAQSVIRLLASAALFGFAVMALCRR